MKIRTRLWLLLVVTLTALIMSVSMFFIYSGENHGLQKMRVDTLNLNRQMYKLRFLSDELLTSRNFEISYDAWSSCVSLTNALVKAYVSDKVIARTMNSDEDARQRDALNSVWGQVMDQAKALTDISDALSKAGITARVDSLSLTGAVPEAVVLEQQGTPAYNRARYLSRQRAHQADGIGDQEDRLHRSRALAARGRPLHSRRFRGGHSSLHVREGLQPLARKVRDGDRDLELQGFHGESRTAGQ